MAYYPRFKVLTRDGAWFHVGESVDRLVLGQRTTADDGGARLDGRRRGRRCGRGRGRRREAAAEAEGRLTRGR